MVILGNPNVFFFTIPSGLEAWVCDQHKPMSETSKVNEADFE
jgi:hypothetical protein